MIEFKTLNLLVGDNRSERDLLVLSIFKEEVEKRSRLAISYDSDSSCVSFGFYTEDSLPSQYREYFPHNEAVGKEGFRIKFIYENDKVNIIVCGADYRGELYGAGWILRKSSIYEDKMTCPKSLDGFSITPTYPLRGHQLGYRDKQNTLPSWDEKMFESYIRELALFGTNSIELLPPRSDDMLFSAHFVKDPYEMMASLSRIIHHYGLDCWLWYPNLGLNFDNKEKMEKEMAEREKVFSTIPYLDGLLVPLGDPGNLPPNEAFRVTECFTSIMKKYHKNVKVWVAPQHFAPEPGWYKSFYEEVKTEPKWLYGIAFAPWEEDDIDAMQAKLPNKYKGTIRHYCDISHNTDCQFPVHEWDLAFALTIGREGVNMRPHAMKMFQNHYAPYTIGSITYSEGVHDDLNKFVWGDQDYSASISEIETVEDYSRFFISPIYGKEIAALFLNLESAWSGPIFENKAIDANYEALLKLDAKVDDKIKGNFRYQLLKLRVLADKFTRDKRYDDLEAEKKAYEILSHYETEDCNKLMDEAALTLVNAQLYMGTEALLCSMQKLSDELYNSCRIRLTVKHHGGQAWIRGSFLETARMPLNDTQYLLQSFKQIRSISCESSKKAALEKLCKRTNPGEGSFYYNLGSADGFKLVEKKHSYESDPGFLRTPLRDHSIYRLVATLHDREGWYNEVPLPLSWIQNAEVIYGTPLVANFSGLDSSAEYTLEVVYTQMVWKMLETRSGKPNAVDCVIKAGDIELANKIQPLDDLSDMYWRYELPKESYKDGNLKLSFLCYGVLAPFGVSDVRIIKK